MTVTLRDHDPAVRLQTVLALQKVGHSGAARALGEVLAEDKDLDVRRAAVRTLEKLGGGDAWWALLNATSDPDSTIRKAAAAAIRP